VILLQRNRDFKILGVSPRIDASLIKTRNPAKKDHQRKKFIVKLNPHVIGGKRDSEDMELLTALKQIVGYGTGTVISCIPGKLAKVTIEILKRGLKG
jgi:hypothetical protein